MKKRYLSLFLVMAMLVLSVFTGLTAVAEAEDGPLTPYAEPVEITWAVQASAVQQFIDGDTYDNNVWSRLIKEKLNIDLKVALSADISTDAYNNQMNLLLASGDFPDVVRDIEKAAQKWGEILGIEPPAIRINHLEGNEHYTYRGEPVSCDLKVADIHMNGFVIELHEPIGGPSSFQEFLDKHGNGVHHIGFEVGEDRDAVIESLTEAGFDANRTLGIYPGSSWTIVDGEDTLGVNLNIKPVR